MYNKFHPLEQMNRRAIAQEYRRIRAVLKALSVKNQGGNHGNPTKDMQATSQGRIKEGD